MSLCTCAKIFEILPQLLFLLLGAGIAYYSSISSAKEVQKINNRNISLQELTGTLRMYIDVSYQILSSASSNKEKLFRIQRYKVEAQLDITSLYLDIKTYEKIKRSSDLIMHGFESSTKHSLEFQEDARDRAWNAYRELLVEIKQVILK